jgi:hypothetical protein
MKPRLPTVLLVAVLWIAGCGTSLNPGLPADAFQAEADAVVVMAMVTSTDGTPAPDDSTPDRKVGDKCDNCHGTGRSGDGLGQCRVCKGDGRIDEDDLRARGSGPRLLEPAHHSPASTLQTPETLPMTIVLHVSQASASGWARDWWNQDKPYFEQLGYQVSFVKENSGETWIKVCGPTTCKRVDGQPNRAQLLAVVKETK